MRNPKTMYLLTVIVGVLLLGVAYAAVQNITLTINGTAVATPDQGNFIVKFTGTPSSTVVGHGTAVLNITGDTTATMNVSNMTTIGDIVTSKFTVINESTDLTAYLSTLVSHTNTEYFKVTATLDSEQLAPQNATTVLNLAVELLKTPTDRQTDTIDVYLVASPTEMSGELISFTIDRTEYVVAEGTTWSTWFKDNGWQRVSELDGFGVHTDFSGYDSVKEGYVYIFNPYVKEWWTFGEATAVAIDDELYDTPIEAGEYYTITVQS